MGVKSRKMLNYKKVETTETMATLSDLIQVIWPEVFTPVLGATQVDYMLDTYQSIDQIKSEISGGVQYELILRDNEPVGYLAYAIEESQLFISKLYFLASSRGQGLSRQVFERFEKIAKSHGKSQLHLHVNRDNTRALTIYQHYGFEIVQVVDTPFGEYFLNDYWMTKKL